MIRWCGSITIWRWSGLLSSFWWMARWTTAGRTCSILSVRTVNGLLLASQIRDGRIAFAGRPNALGQPLSPDKVAYRHLKTSTHLGGFAANQNLARNVEYLSEPSQPVSASYLPGPAPDVFQHVSRL